MEKEQLLDRLSDKARNIGVHAEWYAIQHCVSLSECCRVAQRAVLDFIAEVREKCDTDKSVLELLDQKKYEYWSEYKYFQSEKIERFAELSMVKDYVLGYIDCIVAQKQTVERDTEDTIHYPACADDLGG